MQALGVIDRLIYGEWEGKPGDKITESLNLILIVTSLLLLRRGFRRTRSIRTSALLAVGVAGLMLLSTLWSIDPQTTLRRGFVYLFVIVGSIGIAGSMGDDEFMDVLALTCAASAVASILLLVIPLGQALAESTDFTGIFAHKNVLGQVMAAGTLASLHCIRLGHHRLRNAIFLALFTIVALASKSVTSCMTLLAFCGIDGVLTLVRKGGVPRLVAIATIAVLSPVVVPALIFPDSLLELLGKDPTLTGRTEVWAYTLPDIAEKPLLGWGYSAFWSPNNPAAVDISDALKWYVPQAHNGLLEMLLNIGAIGAFYFVFLWARTIGLALRCMRTPAGAGAISPLLVCIGIFLIGISESVLMEPLQITTTIFFVTGFMSERALRLAQRQRSIRPSRLGSRAPVRACGPRPR
jgi:O-antigen ligase